MGKILPRERKRNTIWKICIQNIFNFTWMSWMNFFWWNTLMKKSWTPWSYTRVLNLQEERRETNGISSTDEVGSLFECFFLLTNSDLQKKWNGKEIYAYSFPKSTKIKTIYFTPNSLNSCKIVMWITYHSSNMM